MLEVIQNQTFYIFPSEIVLELKFKALLVEIKQFKPWSHEFNFIQFTQQKLIYSAFLLQHNY